MWSPADTTAQAVIALPLSVEPEAGWRFESDLVRLLSGAVSELLLDCSELDQVCSGHIRLMWVARGMCTDRGISLRLVSVRPDIVRILRLLDLIEFFPFEVCDRTRGYADAIPISGATVREALDRFDAFLRQLQIPGPAATDLRTIFYEVTSNIVQHGGLDSGEVVVMTALPSAKGRDREMTLRFIDSGVPFDPTQPRPALVPANAASDRRTRGYGLAMMTRLADSVSYQRFRGAHNILTLSKRWSV
jgi:anti-sigma regulatory factor (Ser/Thr protein kinase)/anti-anti-sigma regulatory factor